MRTCSTDPFDPEYTYISFPKESKAEERALIMGSALLANLLYFQLKGSEA